MRAAAIILTAVLAVLAVIIVVGHLANPNAACLNIEGYKTDILDPKTGNTFVMPNQPTAIPGQNDELASAYSSDGKRFAHFYDLSRTGLRVTAQAVAPLGYDRRDKYFDYAFLNEIQWSPDDQWIVYRWKGTNQKQYLAIADAEGHERNFTMLDSVPGQETQIDSWSPDDKYIAIIYQDGDGENGSIRFLSIPDLKLYNPSDLGKRVGSGCVGPDSADVRMHCNPWPAQGHEAIYMIDKDETSSSLIFLNLDTRSTKNIPLPRLGTETVRISPDGKSVAVGAFSGSDPTNPSSDGQLNVYSVDGQAKTNISAVTFLGAGNADGPIIADITWSPDSKYFVYARHMPDSPKDTEIMLYRPRTGQNDEILTHLPENNYSFAFTGDGKYLAVLDPYPGNDNKAHLVQIDGYITRSVDVDQLEYPAVWSSDGQLLALTEGPDNNTGRMAVRVIARDGNDIRRMDVPYVENLGWTPCG